MGVPATLGDDSLRERAAMTRESLQKSQTITDNVVSILGSFDHRLSALETAVRALLRSEPILFAKLTRTSTRLRRPRRLYLRSLIFLARYDGKIYSKRCKTKM